MDGWQEDEYRVERSIEVSRAGRKVRVELRCPTGNLYWQEWLKAQEGHPRYDDAKDRVERNLAASWLAFCTLGANDTVEAVELLLYPGGRDKFPLSAQDFDRLAQQPDLTLAELSYEERFVNGNLLHRTGGVILA
jgi:hypothetical protein